MQKEKKKIKFFKKKALSIVLIVALLFTIVQPITINASAGVSTDYWTNSGNYDTSWYNTIDTNFTLTTAQQLAGLAVLNNGLNGETLIDFSGKIITISANIDLLEHLWTPIGNRVSTNFNGTFDGNSYDISNLQIDNNLANYQGLFGSNNGTIQNVNIKSGTVIGGSNVGGIVGYNNGIVKGCSNSATVSGSYQVGGVAGNVQINKVVTNCYNTGKVTGTGMFTGGIAGDNYGGSVTNCYNTGEVHGVTYVGGIVGANDTSSNPTLQNCYNTAKVTGTNWVGGIIGYNWIAGIVNNSYNIGQVTGNSYVGGITGQNDKTITNCYYYGYNIGIGGAIQDTVGQTTQFVKINDNPLGVGKYTTIKEETTTSLNTAWNNVLGTDFSVAFSDEYSSLNSNAAFAKVETEKRIAGVSAGTTKIAGIMTINQNKLTDTGFTGASTTIVVPISLPLTVDNGTNGLEIIKSTPTISLITIPDSIDFGDSGTLTATVSGGASPTGTVTFKSGSTVIGSPAAIVNGVATINYTPSIVGTSIITAEYSGDTFNNGVVSSEKLVSSKMGPALSISVNPTSPGTYPNSVTVTAAISGTYEQANSLNLAGKTIIFEVDGNANSVAVDASGNATYTFIPSSVKTYLIKASYDGTSDIYNNSANSSEISYDVEKGTQGALSISNIPSTVIYGDNSFTISTTGGSGTGDITYSSSNTSILTVDENTGAVTVVGAGDAIITATKADDSNYNSISVTTPVTVNKKDININNLIIKDKIYDGTTTAEFSGTPEIIGVISGDIVTLINGTPSFISENVGSSIGINFTAFSISGAKSENYNLIQPSGVTANINKGDQSTLEINNVPSTVTYGDNPFTLSTTGGSGTGAITYSSSNTSILTVDENTGAVTVVGAGDTTITAIKAADGNYNSVNTTATITVNKKNITVINTAVKDKNYDGTTTAEFSETPQISGAIIGDTVNLIEGTPSFTSKYYSANSIQVNFTDFSIDGIDAGNYAIIQPNMVSAKINKKDITIIDIQVKDKSYDETTTAEFAGTPKLSGVISGDTVTLTNGIPSFASKYYSGSLILVNFTDFSIGGIGAGNYSLLQPSSASANISKATQSTVEISNAPSAVIYGDSPFTLSTTGGSGTGAITYSSSNTNVLIVDENTGITTVVGAGDTTITATKAADSNYNSVNTTATITVNKATLTVSTSNLSIISGESLPQFNVVVTGFIKGETENNIAGFVKPIVIHGVTDTTKVGSYPLTFGIGNATNNYRFSPLGDNSLTIIEKINAEKPKFDKAAEAVTYIKGTVASSLNGSATVTDGGNVSYQWYKNTENNTITGTLIPGATDKSYIPSTDKTGVVYYYLVATNTNNGVNGDKTGISTSNVYKSTVNKVEILPTENKADTPNVAIQGNAEDIKDKLLTDMDKVDLNNGSLINFKLNVEMVETPVSEGDKNSVNSALNGQILGIYLDISILKNRIDSEGNETNEKVTETNSLIRLIIDVPENLRNTNRIFSIVRVHDGVAEILVDLDNDPNTITIETDRFSTYALVYEDEVTNTSATTTSTETGDNTPIIPIVIFTIGSLLVGVNIFRKSRFKINTKK